MKLYRFIQRKAIAVQMKTENKKKTEGGRKKCRPEKFYRFFRKWFIFMKAKDDERKQPLDVSNTNPSVSLFLGRTFLHVVARWIWANFQLKSPTHVVAGEWIHRKNPHNSPTQSLVSTFLALNHAFLEWK